LLGQGGLLVGYFYFDDVAQGPPFGITRAALDDLLCPAFECIADEAVEDSIPVFAGKERWMIWRQPKKRARKRAPDLKCFSSVLRRAGSRSRKLLFLNLRAALLLRMLFKQLS